MTEFTIVMQCGRPFQVPSEHADKFIQKNGLVEQASALEKFIKSEDVSAENKFLAERELRNVMSKIIKLNRKIPRCARSI